MRLLWIALLVSCLGASNALGQSWHADPGGSGSAQTSVNPGSIVWYNFNDTTDAGILGTKNCNPVVVCLNPDKDGANTGAAGYVRGCLTNVDSATECVQIQVDGLDQTLTGAGSTNRACVAVWSPWIFFDVTANAGADNALVSAFCVR